MKKLFTKLKNFFKRFKKQPIQSQILPKEQPKPINKNTKSNIVDLPSYLTEESFAEELRKVTNVAVEKENSKNKEDYNDLLKKL